MRRVNKKTASRNKPRVRDAHHPALAVTESPTMRHSPATSPILAGLALAVLGALLRPLNLRALDMPDRPHKRGDFGGKGLTGAARKSRDAVGEVLPGNLTDSLGRTLMILGAGLILFRALDATLDDKDRLY